jgi:hypothetical protein
MVDDGVVSVADGDDDGDDAAVAAAGVVAPALLGLDAEAAAEPWFEPQPVASNPTATAPTAVTAAPRSLFLALMTRCSSLDDLPAGDTIAG